MADVKDGAQEEVAAGTIWDHIWYRVEPMVAFTTAKTVRFLDFELASSFYIGVLLCIIFAAYDIIDKQAYLETAFPTNIVQLSLSETSPKTDKWAAVSFTQEQAKVFAEEKRIAGEVKNYCNNPKYDFTRTDVEKTYTDIACEYMDSSLMSKVGDGSMFIATLNREKQVKAVKMDPSKDETCDMAFFNKMSSDVAENLGVNVPMCTERDTVKLQGGVCKCEGQETSSFTVGPANLTLTIEHAYQSEFYSRYQPKTFVRKYDAEKGQNEAVFEANEPIILPIGKILEIAGVNLDARNKNVTIGHCANSQKCTDEDYPFYRLTGVTISMSMEYVNFKNNPDSRAARTPVAFLKIKADVGGWAYRTFTDILGRPSQAKNKDYLIFEQNGINLQFTYSGMVSRFNFFSLVASIATALVLIRNVELVIKIIGISLPTAKARTYNQVCMHRYSFHRAYARFAANAIQAHHAFKMMDTDNSGMIDRHDLYEALKRIFIDVSHTTGEQEEENKLNLVDIKVLTEFITQEADSSLKGMEHLKRGDGKVSLGEWVDIVTDDSSNFTTLVGLVSSMKEDKKENLLRAFHKDSDIVSHYGPADASGTRFAREAEAEAFESSKLISHPTNDEITHKDVEVAM